MYCRDHEPLRFGHVQSKTSGLGRGSEMTHADLLNAAQTRPEELRQLLRDPQVVAVLASLGVQLTVYELHAPSEKSRTNHGLGPTRCNDRARRHPTLVTCKKCLKKPE
jgi:hypothetical protein